MPYTFVDTIEPSPAETMPAEALKLNGEYIENLMDARYCKYRTLYVTGREALSAEINSFETGVRNGASYLSKRYEPRTITVGYYLTATSNYYFRMAFTELNKILNVEEAECIFYDEQDKYFTGTPQGLGDVPAGTNFVKGEFTIFCADPFKYSINEIEVEPTEDEGSTFVVDYNGTAPCYPTLEASFAVEDEVGPDGDTPTEITGDADCGFVAWYNEDEKIIQLGDPDEEEGESFDKSQTLFSQDYRQISSWTSALSSIWTNNQFIYMGCPTNVGCVMNGTPGMVLMNSTEYYISGSSWGGKGSYSNPWYGTSISRTIPADATGETGATDWTLKWSQKLAIGSGSSANAQRGTLQVIVTNDSGKVIAAANCHKGANDAGSKGHIWLYVNTNSNPGTPTKKVDSIDFSYNNARWGHNSNGVTSVKACSIVKSGTKVTFNLGGTTWSFTNSSIANMKATRVTFVCLMRSPYSKLTYMGFYKISFVKDNCTTWRDIPNKFSDNDTATAVCKSGTVLVNDAEAPDYGALGNDWESFYLKPGINQIGFSYSDWCEKPPTTKMRYREVYF